MMQFNRFQDNKKYNFYNYKTFIFEEFINTYIFCNEDVITYEKSALN